MKTKINKKYLNLPYIREQIERDEEAKKRRLELIKKYHPVIREKGGGTKRIDGTDYVRRKAK